MFSIKYKKVITSRWTLIPRDNYTCIRFVNCSHLIDSIVIYTLIIFTILTVQCLFINKICT